MDVASAHTFGATVLGSSIDSILFGAALLGYDRQRILDRAGLARGPRWGPEDRVPGILALRVLQAAMAESGGDADLPLRLALALERAYPPPVPVADPVLALRRRVSAPGTGYDLVERLARLWPVVIGLAQVRLERRAAQVFLIHAQPTGDWARITAELTLATWTLWLRRALGDHTSLAEVRFAHSPRARLDTLRDLFRCPVAFDAEADALIFDHSELLRPISPPPNRGEASASETAASEDGFLLELRAAIAASLAEGAPSAQEVARALGLGARTYRRRLEARGSSHREILATVRRELAIVYLEQTPLSVDEVAARVGYSERSAFTRAFRQWTGRTPASHRR